MMERSGWRRRSWNDGGLLTSGVEAVFASQVLSPLHHGLLHLHLTPAYLSAWSPASLHEYVKPSA